MKLEMGESLILSWLRHVKKCQVVQTNWKISNEWSIYKKDVAEKFFFKVKDDIGNEIFKQSSIEQLLKQSEIDVLGLTFEEGKIKNLYVVDIAYHGAGLNYGSAEETRKRIIKKMARSAITIMRSFDVINANIIFTSPKINNNIYIPLQRDFKILNEISLDGGYGFTFELIANNEFYLQIVEPIIALSSTIADTSELFLRSVQLLKLSEKNKQTNKPLAQVSKEQPSQHKRQEAIPIELIPENSKDFKEQLLKSERAYIKLIYEDGIEEIKPWDASNFSESSNLMGNIRSKDWFKPTKNYRDPVHGKVVRGIVSIEEFVKENLQCH